MGRGDVPAWAEKTGLNASAALFCAFLAVVLNSARDGSRVFGSRRRRPVAAVSRADMAGISPTLGNERMNSSEIGKMKQLQTPFDFVNNIT